MPSQRAAAVWSHIDWSSAATPAAAGHHEISICKWKKALTKWYPKFMADFLNFVWSHVDFWGTQFWECVAIPRTSKECVCVYPNDRNAFSEVAEVKVRNQRWGPAKLFITCIGTYIILNIYTVYICIYAYTKCHLYIHICACHHLIGGLELSPASTIRKRNILDLYTPFSHSQQDHQTPINLTKPYSVNPLFKKNN